MSDAGEGAVKNLGIFSTLESATEFKFFLLAMTFVLMVDNVFLQLHQPGLMELAADPKKVEAANLGLRIILVFVIFSFLTSLALKLGAIIVDEISRVTIGRTYISLDLYLDKIFGNNRFPQQRKFRHVRPLELREEAYIKKDSFYLELYDKCMRQWVERNRAMHQHALYAFYSLSLLGWSWWIGHNGGDSIVAVISKYLGSESYFTASMLGLSFIFLYRFFRKDAPEWIYCPTLSYDLEKRDTEAN